MTKTTNSKPAKKISVKSKKTAPKLIKKISKKTVTAPKKKKVLAIPKGYHSITPYLIIDNAASAIKFYTKVFGAKETMRMDMPNGKVAHAELKMGDAKIMLADECFEMDSHSPKKYSGSPVGIHFYTKAVDEVVKMATKNGAKLLRPVEDMFYGDRSATIDDPYGHRWTISTHIEDVSPAKMRKRAAELFNKKS